MVWGAIAAAGISALSQLGSNAVSYAQNKKLMEMQQDFQERMSSTALQRGVADAKSAGINPLLVATNGGANTPSTGLNSATQMDIAGAMSQGAQAMSNVNLNEANTQLANEQSGTEQTQQALNIANTIEKKGMNKYLDKREQANLEKIGAEIINLNTNSAYARAKQMAITSEIDLNNAMALRNREESKLTSAMTAEQKRNEKWIKKHPIQAGLTKGIGEWTGAIGNIFRGSVGVNHKR